MRPLRTDTSSILVSYVENENTKIEKISNSFFYHWIKGGTIQHTQGGYDGKLLHGVYKEFFPDGSLMHTGRFKKGMKDGEWRSWYTNGNLKSISHWKHGCLEGIVISFNSSNGISMTEHFRKGILHGKKTEYTDTSIVKTNFKNGIKKSSVNVTTKKEQSTKKINSDTESEVSKKKIRSEKAKKTKETDGIESIETEPAK